MQKPLLVLLPLLLAFGVHLILRTPDVVTEPPPAEPEQPVVLPGGLDDPEAARRHQIRARLTSGTLLIRVKTPTGELPLGTEVGYYERGEIRWLYADEQGKRIINSAPLGMVRTAARAPGFPKQERLVMVQKGLPAESLIHLRPSR